ncbi:MAG: DUF4422 domain-containing protein [Sporolactobacillus sp.]
MLDQSSSDVKIIVALHKKYPVAADPLYTPLHVGAAGKPSLGIPGDDTGKNISEKNTTYCELTGIYWAWKNCDSSFIGICHYRRYFSSGDFWVRVHMHLRRQRKFALILTRRRAVKLLRHYEVLVPKKEQFPGETVREHFCHHHHRADLELMRRLIEERQPRYLADFDAVMADDGLYLYNMFVMSRQLMDAYCSWLFPLLAEVERHVSLADYDDYQKRLIGFLGERLFNVWLHHHPLLRVKPLKIINIEDQV